MRERDNARISALRNWLDGLLSAFGDRIHPADAAIAVRAGRLLPFCNQGHVCHRFHDAVLVATAQACGHGLLSKRVTVFGAWTKVALLPREPAEANHSIPPDSSARTQARRKIASLDCRSARDIVLYWSGDLSPAR